MAEDVDVRRVDVSGEAAELIRRLTTRHGPLMFHQSGGCCDGSSPMCFPDGDFITSEADVHLGDLDVGKATSSLAKWGGPTKISMEANAWILGTIAGQAAAASDRKAIVRHAMNKVSETAGAANFTTGYGDGKYLLLASDRRVDSVMLESLIQEQQNNDLIPKIVTGLLAHRKAGRWLNTQENVFALSAMDLVGGIGNLASPGQRDRPLGEHRRAERSRRGW